jgi:YidC/Oxa1 family membrane protein insertase
MALLALLTALLFAAPVFADTPTPGPSGSPVVSASGVPTPIPAPSESPAPSATAGVSETPASIAPAESPAASPEASGSTKPCPNPTAPPTPSPPPSGSPPTPSPSPTHPPNLCPADLKGDPVSLLAWLFTPIFQTLFLGLALSYKVLGDVGLAIIVTTIVIRLLLVRPFRKQIVSQRRMQLLQPELKALQAKYKGNRAKQSEEQMKLYKERGVNPFGCLPVILQMGLLIPMYSVFSQGLSAPDISSMLQLFGHPLFEVACQFPGSALHPCINPATPLLLGGHANAPLINFTLPLVNFGVSLLAVASALLQVIQTRMVMTANPNDPSAKTQQRIFIILPLFSIIYGQFLPAGLFIYWIVTTIFSIVQQYLIVGWGSLFPLFGWMPAFARDHKPRFAVTAALPPPKTGDRVTQTLPTPRSASDRAAGTVRPNRERGRTSRRGRRR